MNGTEELYFYDHLKPRLDSGELVVVKFERIRFILCHPEAETKRRESTYTPDFYCLRSDGEIEIHEVKGFCDEADRIKIKKMAEMFSEFHWFMAHSRKKRQFEIEEF